MAERTAPPAKPKAARKPSASTAQPATVVDPVAATSAASPTGEAKAKFAKALEEARAGAQVLGKQAQDTADAYREKITGRSDALLGDALAMSDQAREKANAIFEDAKAMTEQARERAAALAADSKARAVDGISAVSKIVAENAAVIDEKLGAKYGDYARGAAKSMDDAAARLDAKDIGELGNDAREMVRKSPGLAIGIAAAAGFFLSRLFSGSAKTKEPGADD